MLETYAWNLVNQTDSLTSLREHLEVRLQAAQGGNHFDLRRLDITDTDRTNFTTVLELMRPWLLPHGLTASYDHTTRILDELAEKEPDIRTIISQLKHLNTTLEDELRRRVFLYIPTEEDVSFYKDAQSIFPLTYNAYPSARADIVGACRCHALGCYTASVYHCMAIAQTGLYALAKELGVSFKHSIVLAEWQTVIQAIELKLEPMRSLPREQKDEKLPFYSECAVQFRYFKDAWRNHVAHMRETYDRDQSHSILLHVRDFMEKTSQRLTETA